MERGLVSVMMPAYNAASFIGEAIQSLLAQTYPAWELLIVNDGSTDATAEIADGFQDPRIRLINKENGGESSARNAALEVARGEFIAFLDADDAFLPHHLATMVGFLESHPHCDAVYSDGFHIDENGRRLVSLQSRRRGPFEGRLYEQAVLASDIFGPPLCVVVRHEVIARHHLRYDPRIVIGPDWEFFIRYADLSTFGYVSEQSCLYRVHQSNITARAGATRRVASLAICREKAIKMASFNKCSSETRVAVFYHLLITLLRGQSERRAAAVEWPEFALLPPAEQARLLRLMAVDTLQHGGEGDQVGRWLERARLMDPGDRRTQILAALYNLSPSLCRLGIRARAPFQRGDGEMLPFADLDLDTPRQGATVAEHGNG